MLTYAITRAERDLDSYSDSQGAGHNEAETFAIACSLASGVLGSRGGLCR